MKKLWFYFNTLQLASTFTEFNLVKTPANVSMVKKSYESIIHVKLIPESLMTKLKACFGIKPTVKQEDQPSERRLLQELTSKQIRTNQIILGAIVLVLVAVCVVVFVLRRKIWAKLPQRIKAILISLPRMFMWNGVIRTLLELFYPTTLLALTTAAANLQNKSKLAVPLA